MREEAATVDARLPARFLPSHRRLLAAAPGADDKDPVSNDSSDTVTVTEPTEESKGDDVGSPDEPTTDEACPACGCTLELRKATSLYLTTILAELGYMYYRKSGRHLCRQLND